MSVKTYERKVIRFFTREELATLLKEAHEHCRKNVPYSIHTIGRKRHRTVLARKREDLLDCIKAFIRDKVIEKAKELERTLGIKIDESSIQAYLREVESIARKYGIELG